MFKTVLQAAVLASGVQLAAAEGLNFLFGVGSVSTIAPPKGSGEIIHNSGFSLVTEDGAELYNNAYVNDHAPCLNTGDGGYVSVTSACWDGTVTLYCKGAFDARPDSCSGEYNGETFEGVVDKDTEFIGIAITTSGDCGGKVLNLDLDGCTADNADLSFKRGFA